MNAGWQGGEGDRTGLCCPLIAELEKKNRKQNPGCILSGWSSVTGDFLGKPFPTNYRMCPELSMVTWSFHSALSYRAGSGKECWISVQLFIARRPFISPWNFHRAQPQRHSSCPLPLSSSVGSENSLGFDYLKNEQGERRSEEGNLLTHVKWP